MSGEKRIKVGKITQEKSKGKKLASELSESLNSQKRK